MQCIVLGCESTKKVIDERSGLPVRLHGFPLKDKERCLKWLRFCNSPDHRTLNDLKQNKICSLHFDRLAYFNYLQPGGSPLKDTAVPNLKGPYSSGMDTSEGILSEGSKKILLDADDPDKTDSDGSATESNDDNDDESSHNYNLHTFAQKSAEDLAFKALNNQSNNVTAGASKSNTRKPITPTKRKSSSNRTNKVQKGTDPPLVFDNLDDANSEIAKLRRINNFLKESEADNRKSSSNKASNDMVKLRIVNKALKRKIKRLEEKVTSVELASKKNIKDHMQLLLDKMLSTLPPTTSPFSMSYSLKGNFKEWHISTNCDYNP